MEIKIVYPFQSVIYGDSFKEAIKNFVKLNHNFQINNLILQDQNRRYKAQINYYKQDGRNKIGINMFPVGWNYPIPIVTNDTYIPPRVTDTVAIAPLSPLSPISPVGMPWLPTVVNIPNL
jgi:hypothetical protein